MSSGQETHERTACIEMHEGTQNLLGKSARWIGFNRMISTTARGDVVTLPQDFETDMCGRAHVNGRMLFADADYPIVMRDPFLLVERSFDIIRA